MDKDTIDYVLNVLRHGTVTWKGRTECLNRGRRKRPNGQTKDGEEKFVWENNCELCGVWHDQKDNLFEVDHIKEIGPFTGNFDLYIRKMFCGQDNLQRLCFSCHAKKTSNFNATLRFQRKNPRKDYPEDDTAFGSL